MTLRSIEEELVDYLLADSEIQAFVGGRVGPIPLDQNSEMPAITYFDEGRDDSHTQQGPQCLVPHDFAIDAWAKTYGEMRELSERIRRRLNGFDGPLGEYPRVTIFMDNKRDTYEDESKTHRGILDFTVWYREEL